MEPADAVDWSGRATEALMRGDLATGEFCLRRAAALSPANLDVLGNWAVCGQRLDRTDAATRWLRRVLAIDGNDVEALLALTMVASDQALRRKACRKASVLVPGGAEAWLRCGAVAAEQDPAAAFAFFRRALAAAPDLAPARVGMGLALTRLGRWPEAACAYRQGLALAPERVDAWDGLADPAQAAIDDTERLRAALRAVSVDRYRAAGWHRLGTCLWHQRRGLAAARAYRIALTLVPELVEAMANLGAALRELGQPEATLSWFARAVALVPDSAGAMTNLGTAYMPGSAEATSWHRRALARAGAHPHALNNLGSQHLARNEVGEAARWFDRAIGAGYPDGEARWNRGVARLVAGDLAAGFADYEDRWGLRAFADWRRPFSQPLWKAGPGHGRAVLVHAEQGIGDTLQFVRYLSAVAGLGWRVILECQPELTRLLGMVEGVTSIVAKGAPLPSFDAHAPLLSLPAAFGTTLATIPASVPYLSCAPAIWPELANAHGRRVGLVWAGNPLHKNDSNRSLNADAVRRLFGGLADRPGLSLFSLQIGARRSDLRSLVPAGLDIIDLSPRLTDFADTAAAVAALDLVIAVDTSVIHLTGALGRPGRLLLPFSPDWRWMLDRSDTPWYPTIRLYRQPAPGDWATPVDAVVADLAG